jgi:hypothetical protein
MELFSPAPARLTHETYFIKGLSVIKNRIKSMLKPALLATAASLMCVAPAQALLSTTVFSNVLFNSNWVDVEKYVSTDYLRILGHGQWFCYRGNGNTNNFTEYDAYINVYEYVDATLDPNWEKGCDGLQTGRYRTFTLRLLVERHIAGDFTPYYDKTISWQG